MVSQSAGRTRRKRHAAIEAIKPMSPPRRLVPTTEVFDEESLDKIEAHADWILKDIGSEFRCDPEI